MNFNEVFFADGIIEAFVVSRDRVTVQFVDSWGKHIRISMSAVKSLNVASEVIGYELDSAEIKDEGKTKRVVFYNPDLNSVSVTLELDGEIIVNELAAPSND